MQESLEVTADLHWDCSTVVLRRFLLLHLKHLDALK